MTIQQRRGDRKAERGKVTNSVICREYFILWKEWSPPPELVFDYIKESIKVIWTYFHPGVERGKYIPSIPLQDEKMMGMPRSAHLNTGGRAVGLSKTFFTGLTEGSSLWSLLDPRKINFSPGGGWVGEKSKAAGIVCPDSFVGCDWLLTIHGGLLEWRQRSSPPGSRRASEVPTPGFPAREREAPLRDQNGQWDREGRQIHKYKNMNS